MKYAAETEFKLIQDRITQAILESTGFENGDSSWTVLHYMVLEADDEKNVAEVRDLFVIEGSASHQALEIEREPFAKQEREALEAARMVRRAVIGAKWRERRHVLVTGVAGMGVPPELAGGPWHPPWHPMPGQPNVLTNAIEPDPPYLGLHDEVEVK